MRQSYSFWTGRDDQVFVKNSKTSLGCSGRLNPRLSLWFICLTKFKRVKES